MLGHVPLAAMRAKIAGSNPLAAALNGIPWWCCWRQSRAAQKNKSLTARPNFSSVSCVASTKQKSEPEAANKTRAAKGLQLQWPARRAKSSGNQAGGALGKGRAGPGVVLFAAGAARLQQGARAILREQGELVRRVDGWCCWRCCLRQGRAAQKKQVTDRPWAAFFACQISAMFRVLRALRKQKSEPEAANNAGLLL